jgi:HEAT repeat protein
MSWSSSLRAALAAALLCAGAGCGTVVEYYGLEALPPPTPEPPPLVVDLEPAEIAALLVDELRHDWTLGRLAAYWARLHPLSPLSGLIEGPPQMLLVLLTPRNNPYMSPAYRGRQGAHLLDADLRVWLLRTADGRTRIESRAEECTVLAGKQFHVHTNVGWWKPVSDAPYVRLALRQWIGEVTGVLEPAEIPVSRAGLEALLDRLDDPEPKYRDGAAATLGVLRVRAAIPALLREAESGLARVEALLALGEIRTEAALPLILRALREEGAGDLRYAAIVAAGRLGPTARKALPALVSILKEDSPLAVWALARVAPDSSATRAALRHAALNGTPLTRIAALTELALAGVDVEETVRILTDGLATGEVGASREGVGWGGIEVRKDCARALGRIGAPAATSRPTLERMATGEGLGYRRAAAAALVRIDRALR